jgi:hypothetical protein
MRANLSNRGANRALSTFSDPDAERHIIATASYPGGYYDILAPLAIRADEFQDPERQKIWGAVLSMAKQGKHIDGATIEAEAGLSERWTIEHCDDTTDPNKWSSQNCRERIADCAVARKRDQAWKAFEAGTIDEAQYIEEFKSARLPSPDDAPKFINLEPYVSGEFKQEVPTVANVGGRCLFYSGRLNEIHAEPSCGKTNILIAATIRVLSEGGSVVYIDPEDTPSGFGGRYTGLGGDEHSIARVHYLHNPEPIEIKRAQSWASKNPVAMVCLDGLAESMAAVGADENSASEVLGYFREYLRPFAEAGAAVVIADHVSKSSDGRGRWARGSGAKLGRYDGASYEAEIIKPYDPKQAGAVRLKISKDRNGGAGAMGQIVSEVHFTPGAKVTDVDFREPQGKGEFRPTAIMDKILARLEAGPANKTELRACGKAEYVDKAIRILIEEEQIIGSEDGKRLVFSLAQRVPNPRDTVARKAA